MSSQIQGIDILIICVWKACPRIVEKLYEINSFSAVGCWEKLKNLYQKYIFVRENGNETICNCRVITALRPRKPSDDERAA